MKKFFIVLFSIIFPIYPMQQPESYLISVEKYSKEWWGKLTDHAKIYFLIL